MKDSKHRRRQKAVLILGAVILTAGVLGLMYPLAGSWFNARQHRSVVSAYQGRSQDVDSSRSQQMLEAAREYNARLYARSSTLMELTDEQRAEYDAMLRLPDTDVMGYLDIPKINVSLPIYHGTDDAVLQAGVGHLDASSLPVGGENTHTVLTTHSGIPDSRLFTDLDQMEEGDTFTITVLSQTVTYTVDGTAVMLPEDVLLTIEEGGDTCTLITCTPLGVNSHRLLVHAHRSENEVLPSGG